MDRFGHLKITHEALRLAQKNCENNIAVTQFEWSGASGQVINRDVLDFFNRGHWKDDRQHDHFMRRSKGQSSEQACDEGIRYIEKNAKTASDEIAKIFSLYSPQPAPPSAPSACPVPDMQEGPFLERLHTLARGDAIDRLKFRSESKRLYFSWGVLGDALHALQDSFSPAHCRRGAGPDKKTAGPIEEVFIYTQQDSEAHDKNDQAWRDGDGLSASGKLAAAASAALILFAMSAAAQKVFGGTAVRFSSFQKTWLDYNCKATAQRMKPFGKVA